MDPASSGRGRAGWPARSGRQRLVGGRLLADAPRVIDRTTANAEEPPMGATEVSEAVLAFSEHEHLDLARGVDDIHEAGCTVGARPSIETLLAIRDVLRWAGTTLEPHLAWEERWLYPRIEQLTGTPWSTRSARFDHSQVREVIERLSADESIATHDLTPAIAAELRCRLFSFEALIRAHIQREERLLLPVLVEDAGGVRRTARPELDA
jgi:iron-sulfur cluster repair protein YtfE (RIC family)